MWCPNNFAFQGLRKRFANKQGRQNHAGDGTHSSSKLEGFSYDFLSLREQDYDLTHAHDRSVSKGKSAHRPHLVRLLRLIRSKEEGTITCQLQVKDINTTTRPIYHALSYTWGPTTQTEIAQGMTDKRNHTIICNEKELAITENLFNCLRQLKEDSYYDKDLWVDAICVDQENNLEQGQQISMMNDIYRSAECVVIWLGVEDESTQRAFELISDFNEDWPNIDLDVTKDNLRDYWFPVVSLFARTWFTRAWVIQEILLAQNTVHMKLLPYKNPAKLVAIKKDMDGSGSADILLHSLIRCRTYNALKRHDKVYSLLGLVVPKGQECPELLYPNYDLTAAELYTNVTTYILENVEGLHVLAHAEGDDFKCFPGLPSWVPDWSCRVNVGLRITRYLRYQAAGELPCSKKVLPRGCLALSGAQLDVVTRTGDTKSQVNHSKTCDNWYQLLEELEREYPDRDHRDAFWRTLVVDTNDDGTVPVREPWGDAFAIWTGQADSDELTPEQKKRAAEFETAFLHSINTRLLRTARGHLGLGTTSCRAGDLVWIVPGSRVPLLLRPVERSIDQMRYRLVGGAYLHGYMQGEALQELKEFRDIILI
ncbi:heterokaryon incompatibility protein-domain-containing protein [Camillea tinctor]|nr:heterokaryon incompatibility protein-domain-containing protein [Camillea tinctor]